MRLVALSLIKHPLRALQVELPHPIQPKLAECNKELDFGLAKDQLTRLLIPQLKPLPLKSHRLRLGMEREINHQENLV